MDKIKSKKIRRIPRTISVKSAINLTPNMLRVTLHGGAMSDFLKNSEGAYIKLIFSKPGMAKQAMRTYTVSEQRSDNNEIDVDFMLHENGDSTTHGIAARWAISARAGDEITIAGPGPASFINTDAECFLLAADMTALPALKENLKRLPDYAQGHVFIEIMSEADEQVLSSPKGMDIIWVVNDDPGSDKSPLFQAITQDTMEFHGKKLAAWVACEFKTMKKIRLYLKDEIGVEKSHLYISSYWKRGSNEEQHKVIKQDDANQLSL